MMWTRGVLVRLSVGALLAMSWALCAQADEPSGSSAKWLELAQAQPAPADGAKAAPVAAPADAPAKWEKPIPLTVGVSYVLVSDYIFRGINFSEYAREGREKPNHQMTVFAEYDTGKFGTIGASVWFEWFAAQQQLTPAYGGNNQEIDYTIYYRYAFDSIGLTAETGWIAYTFPPFGRDAHTDYEWYGKLSFDDAKVFGTSVLNPYIAYYHDLDLAKNSSWWEIGISHGFALADYGMKDTPVLKDITVTPSLILGAQHRYFGKLGLANRASTKLANLNYGLEVAYDLGAALGLPEQYGSLGVAGFLNFSQALDDTVLNDEFYGGMKVSYSW